MADVSGVQAVPPAPVGRAIETAPVGIVIADASKSDNPLIYVNPAFEALTGYEADAIIGTNCRFLQGSDTDPTAVSELRAAIAEERATTVELLNYRKDGTPFWNEVTVAPVPDQSGTVTHFVGFQVDVTDRHDAKVAAQERQKELEELIRRIRGLLIDVTELLMRARSRAETEQALCDRIRDADPYRCVMIGELDVVHNSIQITAQAESGNEAPTSSLDLQEITPIAEVIESRTITSLPPEEIFVQWKTDIDVLMIAPLAYAEREYGVLMIGLRGPQSFKEYEMVVVETLARTISIAINANEGRRIISADQLVNVRFETTNPALPFVALANVVDAKVEYAGTVWPDAENPKLFFTVASTSRSVTEAIEETPFEATVDIVRSTEHQVTVAMVGRTDSLIHELARRGARIDTISVDNGIAAISIDVPLDGNPRTVVDWFLQTYPDSELTRYRETDQPKDTVAGGKSTTALTDRQLAAIQTAFLGGYYEPTRSITGEEVAELLGVTRATFHQHRRAAERKIIRNYLE